MFEPENDIERLLMRASTQPSERPAFARAIVDAEVFVVLVADRPIVPGPDGNTSIAEGTKLSLPSVVRGEEKLIPFFTAPSRARAWYTGDHVVAPERTRDLFGRYPDTPFVLNPGSDYGKDFTAPEVKRMLAGQFEQGPQTIITQAPEQVLLAHPKQIPTALIEALAREFAGLDSVRGAWLMLAMRAGESEQSWMLGVDHKGSWQEVRDAIGRAVAGDVLGGRMLDAKPLDSGELSVTLRSGIPVTAAKRGFLQKLFR
jgi:SseB protein C-terminal domain/SseB protein N-terminal domain